MGAASCEAGSPIPFGRGSIAVGSSHRFYRNGSVFMYEGIEGANFRFLERYYLFIRDMKKEGSDSPLFDAKGGRGAKLPDVDRPGPCR